MVGCKRGVQCLLLLLLLLLLLFLKSKLAASSWITRAIYIIYNNLKSIYYKKYNRIIMNSKYKQLKILIIIIILWFTFALLLHSALWRNFETFGFWYQANIRLFLRLCWKAFLRAGGQSASQEMTLDMRSKDKSWIQ